MSSPKPSGCNYLISLKPIKLCGKPVVGTISQCGYCAEHIDGAVKMFGPMKPVVKEELFDENR